MSQAAGHNVATVDSLYEVTVETPEDLEAVEAYALENPGTKILVDYDTEVVSRGALEELQGDPREHRRMLGGATSYADENSYGIVQSDGCFQEFRGEIFRRLADTVDGELYMDNKDIFLDRGRGREDPKVVGFGARVGPNLYGASWREGPATDETEAIIDGDVTDATSEEYDRLSFTGASLWEDISRAAESRDAAELIADTGNEFSTGTRDPKSCVVHYRPDVDKEETAVNYPL